MRSTYANWALVVLGSLLHLAAGENDSMERYYWQSVQGNAPQLIQLRGFQSENHTVITPDGYVIQIFRVVNQARSPKGSSSYGYPLIIFNGLLLAAEAYLDNADGLFNPQKDMYTELENNFRSTSTIHCPPNAWPERSGRSLVFTLAACGYDVWLPNVRDAYGYASHLVLDPNKDPEYWNINLDSYTTDAKAIIDYVLQVSKSPTLGAFCHSISCNSMLQLLAEYSQYNDLVKPLIFLAPLVYSQHVTSIPLTLPAFIEPFLNDLLMSTPDIRSIRPFYSNLVRINPLVRFITLVLFSFVGGINFNEVDTSRTYRITAHFPANVAFRVLAHVGQRRLMSGKTDLLPKYDYGQAKNEQVYGQSTPPGYNLTRVSNANIVIFRGNDDILADPLDLDRLQQILRVPYLAEFRNAYSHTDFIFARSVNVSVNLPVLRLLHQLQLNYH